MAISPYSKTANTKAYYKLESDGSDSSGNGKNLSPAGSPSYVAGIFDNCVNLPGSSSVLSIVDNLGISGGACTISCWIKLGTDISSSANNFLQQNAAATITGNGISYEYNSGTRRLFFRRSKWNVAHEGPYYNITLGTTNWYNIVYSYDGANIRGYVNGSLVAGPTSASGNGTGSIGNLFTLQGTDVAANVKIDEVIVENIEWTPVMVSQYYYKILPKFTII